MRIPTLTESTEAMRHRWDSERYPKLVYVSTTNWCNGKCVFCPYSIMERPATFMSLPAFKAIADKVLGAGLQIGAMFCFGEPMADRTICDKVRYARSLNVLTDYIGINTNAALLTSDKFDDVLGAFNNLTLSFVNTGDAFEALTGLNWAECYANAVAFIRYRDQHKPNFKIEIGCNDVPGHDRARVKAAFAAFRVAWARDNYVDYGERMILGVVDRAIMHRDWVCDGYKGAMQIMANGNCCFCAFDAVRDETAFANILTDDWQTIEENFKALWREPSSLCLRCDFWQNYHQMRAGGWKRGPHIDSSWQVAYGDGMVEFWHEQHTGQDNRYLTGSILQEVKGFLQLHGWLAGRKRVLNIGVGTGQCTRDLIDRGHNVSVLDIDADAIEQVADIATGCTNPSDLPGGTFDLAICHLVIQHMADVDVYALLRHVLRSLKADGTLALQYAAPPQPEVYAEDIDRQQRGMVRRTPDHVDRIVRGAGGRVVYRTNPRQHDPNTASDDNVWHGCHIQRASGPDK